MIVLMCIIMIIFGSSLHLQTLWTSGLHSRNPRHYTIIVTQRTSLAWMYMQSDFSYSHIIYTHYYSNNLERTWPEVATLTLSYHTRQILDNLREDNLRREDKGHCPKVSSLRRFNCIDKCTYYHNYTHENYHVFLLLT